MNWCKLLLTEVTLGEVDCWFRCGGTLVGVLVLRVMWLELDSRSSMSNPRWSVRGECHKGGGR